LEASKFKPDENEVGLLDKAMPAGGGCSPWPRRARGGFRAGNHGLFLLSVKAEGRSIMACVVQAKFMEVTMAKNEGLDAAYQWEFGRSWGRPV
jgi:hypothetical protein